MNLSKLILFYFVITLVILCGCNGIDDDKQIVVSQIELPNCDDILIGGSNNYILPFVYKNTKISRIIMDDCGWCRILPNKGSQDSTTFAIAVDKNQSSMEREIRFSVILEPAGWRTPLIYRLTQGVAGSSENGWVEIETSSGGQLESKLNDLPAGNSGVVRLRVAGPLDDSDCKVIEEAAHSMPGLRFLDLENSIIEKFADKTFCNNSLISELTLPKKLTSIGKAFYFDEQSNNQIFKINVPENSSLKYIDDSAFRNCRNLNFFDIPKDVTYIGAYAFYNCKSLASLIVIPQSAGIVKPYAFCNTEMHFPDNFVFPEMIKEIGESAFYNIARYSSANIDLPKGLARMGKAAFCNARININSIPADLKEIPDYAFYGCGINQSLVIPSNIEKIGNHAFQNNYFNGGDWTLNISEGVKYIGDFAFANSYYLKGDVVIPGSTEMIGESCFADCRNMNGKLVLNDGLKVIKQNAFSGTNVTGNLYIPKTLTSIENNAFANCRNITGNLVIPSTLVTIGEKAFYNCSRLEGLDLSGAANLNNIGISAFEACVSMHGNLSLPSKLTVVEPYTFKNAPFDGVLTMADNVKSIGQEAFMENEFKKISLSSALEKIDYRAFINCGSLKEFSLPSNIKYIGNEAFYNCSSLACNLVLPSELEYLGNSAFTNCKLTGTLTFPPKITRIEDRTFWGCNFTGDLIIPDAIEYLGNEAFAYCRELAGKLIIGKGIKKIGDYAFDNTPFNGEVVIPDNVEIIGEKAFSYSKFTTLILGKGVKSIGLNALFGSSLQTVKSYAIIPPTTTSYNFSSSWFTLFVPSGSLNQYKTAEGWKDVKLIRAF